MKNRIFISQDGKVYVVLAESSREDYEKYPADNLLANLNDTKSFNPSGLMPDITLSQKIF